MRESLPVLARFWCYQRERFPVVAYGSLSGAFSLAAVCYTAMLLGASTWPPVTSLLAAFISAFVFFLQLRIADEFKDFADDCRYRPHRAVPRGLVSLRELAVVGAAGGLAQALLAWLIHPGLLLTLAGVWIYLAAMTREFWVARWLRARPAIYMGSHMLVVPLIALHLSAFEWLGSRPSVAWDLAWLLTASFFLGAAIEIGRKTRAPADEQPGVDTYSARWGLPGATVAWCGAVALAGVSGTLAAKQIGWAVPFAAIASGLTALCVVCAIRFLAAPMTRRARWLEPLSGAVALTIFAQLGPMQLGLESVGLIR